LNSIEHLFSTNEIKTLENIVDTAIKVSNAQTGSLLLARDDGSLFIAAGRDLLDKYIGSRVELDKKTVSGYVFKTGEPFIIDDKNISQFSRRKERKSYSISLPIKKTTNRVVGILNLNRTDKSFEKKSIPQLEAFATNIAILLEENNLRQDRERIIIVLSEIIELFSSLCCNDNFNAVFEKIYYAVKILTGVKRASVFKLSKKRPYLVFAKEWPRKMNWKKFDNTRQQVQNLIDQKKVTLISDKAKTQLLFIPLISDNHPPFLFVGIIEKDIDIIDYLVLSIIENMGNSTLENITLFKNSKKLTQEKERNRFARELHDGLAQILASTQIYLHFLENTIPKESQNEMEILNKIKSLNTLGIEESRFILSELKGKPITTTQFKEKIDEITSLFIIPGNKIHINYRVEMKEIPYRIYKMFLKILQEILSNIQKHAQASLINIHITNSKRQMILSVEDNGIGFDPQIFDEKGAEHFGLQNLQERVRILKGKFIIDSKSGRGTKIMVKIPYEENDSSIVWEGLEK
jgi:signal transduction histidine kinase